MRKEGGVMWYERDKRVENVSVEGDCNLGMWELGKMVVNHYAYID